MCIPSGLVMKQTLKILLLLSIPVLLAGCKLAIIVIEGGEVQSVSSGTCVASAICIVDVTDPNFYEYFTATPDAGWYFQKWNSGDRFFCGDYTDATCGLSFSFTGHEDSQFAEDMVTSSETFYLMPVFAEVNDIIEVGGKEWLQPILFLDLAWNDIDDVCPHDTGVCSGLLNGYDVTGWKWASVNDVNDLFNYYLGSELLGSGPDGFFTSEVDPDLSPIFDGWVPTGENWSDGGFGPKFRVIWGSTRNARDDDPISSTWSAYWGENGEMGIWTLTTRKYVDKRNGRYDRGAWFYRIP